MRNEYSQEIIDKVIDNYVNKHMGRLASGREFGLSDRAVKKILKDAGIRLRTHREATILRNKKLKKYDNNSNYFSTESPNMAYIMGFIAADGTIRKNSNSIKITVSRRDRELLEKIKEEVGIEVEVKDFTTNQGYDCSTLEWTDQKHKEDLAKYSIVPEKTFVLRPPTKLKREYWIDYIRGYFDGDGSINNIKNSNGRGNGSIRWQVCSATKELIDWIVDFFNEEYGIPKVNVQTRIRNHEKPLYIVQYSSRASRMIYKVLYSESSLYLARKKEIFDNLMTLIEPMK